MRQIALMVTMTVTIVLLAMVGWVPHVVGNEVLVTQQQLLDDAADGTLDDFSLLQASLVASGVTNQQEIDRYCSEYDSRIQGILNSRSDSGDVEARERIYRFLYNEFLSGDYHSTCTEVDRAFDDGDYNCVTATVLYHCLCATQGLSPVAVATNTHVRSRFLDGSVFDVETTCRDWFEVVRRDPNKQRFRTQQQVTRQLTDIELLAKIYYNRAVSLLEAKSFSQAITLLETSQQLDPADKPTRENLAAAFNNWALAECHAGHFEHAVDLIREGNEQYPEFKPYASNDVHIHQRWVVALCAEYRFEAAMQALQLAHMRRPDVDLFDRGRLVVLGQWATCLLENDSRTEAAQLFANARGWCSDASELSRYRANAIQAATEHLLDAGRHQAAAQLERWAVERESAS
jgi:tetratricopeptide (TPR) repeat protein